MKKTKWRIGFRGKEQAWLFAIWKEYWYGDKVVFARTVFVIHRFPWED